MTSETPIADRIAKNLTKQRLLSGQKLPVPDAPRVLVVANQKGGVGKTTTTVNLATAFARMGMRVLVIDADPQGNASTALSIPHTVGTPDTYQVLMGECTIEQAIQASPEHPNLKVLPATIDLSGAEIELVTQVAREARLRRAIDTYLANNPTDYILIDCPPSLGLLTLNACVAATEVVMPIQAEYYALEGLSQLTQSIDGITRAFNPRLHLSAILLTMFDARTLLSSEVHEEVKKHFPDAVLETVIPRSVKLAEAPSFNTTIFSHDPAGVGAISYMEAALEIGRRM
ncbi:MAG: ParA family protein [Actinomycetaceae bacterium]|nr:ParA family protein [Actinomycetaceae bacterium]